jgi:hypothetical protein
MTGLVVGAKSFGCAGNTIRLRSGQYLDLADPRPEQIALADIAGGLSKICRFGGQVSRFYSVAEHSVLCAIQAEEDGLPIAVQRAALLHDAAEAFCGDMVKPLKIMIPAYQVVEKAVMGAIRERFGLTDPDAWEPVEEIDRSMLMVERRALFTPDRVQWTGESKVRRLTQEVLCLSPCDAESDFMHYADRLGLASTTVPLCGVPARRRSRVHYSQRPPVEVN